MERDHTVARDTKMSKVASLQILQSFSDAMTELAEKVELVSKLLAEGKLSLDQGMLDVLLESINILAKYIETDYHERDIELLKKLGTLCDL